MVNRYIITVLLLLIAAPVWALDPSRYFGKSYAVVIGIRNYPTHWHELKYAEKDAKAIAELLGKQGFEVRLFIGREATRNNIISYIENELATYLTTDDRIVFYFSGHGTTQNLGGSDFGYIIPYEGTDSSVTWISMATLREFAQKLGYARHQLFIFDSCFGGLFGPTKGYVNSRPEDTPNYIAEVAKHRARQYMTAGGAKESTPAYSQLPGYREHSHYTAYLLKGLKGAADTYPDGVITAHELEAYLGPAATSNINRPCADTFAGHEQGEFLFRSPLPATATRRDIFRDTEGKGGYDEDKHDWEMLSKLYEGGLQYYLYLHPQGKWVNEARTRIDWLRKKIEVDETTRPLSMVELNSPDIRFTFLSTGQTYRTGEAFPPPKTIDCSRLRLKPSAFKDAIEAGALVVRIQTPQQVRQIVTDKDVKKTVSIKPVYGGVLALCNVSNKATGPDSRSYNIRGLDDYLVMGRDGRVSVVGAMLPHEDQKNHEYFLKELIENTEEEMEFTYQYTDSSRFSWMLWLTDRPTIFTNLNGAEDKIIHSPPSFRDVTVVQGENGNPVGLTDNPGVFNSAINLLTRVAAGEDVEVKEAFNATSPKFLINSGTEISRLESSGTGFAEFVKVKILEGAHKDETGWIHASTIHQEQRRK